MTTNATYTIDAYLSTQSDESDPDPYFHMTANDVDDVKTSLCTTLHNDMTDAHNIALTFNCDDDSNVTMYDIVVDERIVGIAYIEIKRMSTVEQLRALLHAYVDDSIDQLLDDDYNDADDDVARAQRLIDAHNLVHVLSTYEQTPA